MSHAFYIATYYCFQAKRVFIQARQLAEYRATNEYRVSALAFVRGDEDEGLSIFRGTGKEVAEK